MVATVFVGNLYEIKDRPVPGWAQTTLLYYAARLLGYCTWCIDEPLNPVVLTPCSSLSDVRTGSNDQSVAANGAKVYRKWQRRPSYRLVTLLENPDCTPRLPPLPNNSMSSTNLDKKPETVGHDNDDGVIDADRFKLAGVNRKPVVYLTATGNASEASRFVREVAGAVALIPRDNSVGNSHENTVPPAEPKPATLKRYSKDWANVAAVCDRLFFWLCFVLTIGTTAMLFRPLIQRETEAWP